MDLSVVPNIWNMNLDGVTFQQESHQFAGEHNIISPSNDINDVRGRLRCES